MANYTDCRFSRNMFSVSAQTDRTINLDQDEIAWNFRVAHCNIVGVLSITPNYFWNQQLSGRVCTYIKRFDSIAIDIYLVF